MKFKVSTNDSDVAVLRFKDQERAKENLLIPIAYEEYETHYYIIAKKGLSKDDLIQTPM